MPVEYRIIEGFPNYRVGDDGSVWSKVRLRVTKGTIQDGWRLRKPGKHKSGHLRVTLFPGRVEKKVHHLVLEAFVGPCPTGMEGCHFPDRDPSNNNLTNLRWGTRSDNCRDAVIHGTFLGGVNGTKPLGEKHPLAKLTDQDVRAIRAGYKNGDSKEGLARRFGISAKNVRLIVTRMTWRHVAD